MSWFKRRIPLRLLRLILGVVPVWFSLSVLAGEGRIQLSQSSVATSGVTGITISSPGSYVLVENLVISNAFMTGIEVDADDVTIDLNGFVLMGPGANAGDGIRQTVGYNSATLRNGTLSSWKANALSPVWAVEMSGDNNLIQNVTVRDSDLGIRVGDGAIVADCLLADNIGVGEGSGIQAAGGTRIVDCTIKGTDSSTSNTVAISTRDAGVISGCAIYDNGAAQDFVGIQTRHGSVVHRCSVYNNRDTIDNVGIDAGDGSVIHGVTVNGNQGTGGDVAAIQVGDGGIVAGSVVKNHTLSLNNGYGIYAGTGAIVADCTADNIQSFYGFGIRIGTNSLVEGCNVVGNWIGILTGDGCLVRNNEIADNDMDGLRSGLDNLIFHNHFIHNLTGYRAQKGYSRVEGNSFTLDRGVGPTKIAMNLSGGRCLVVKNHMVRDSDVSLSITNRAGNTVGAIRDLFVNPDFVENNAWANFDNN